MDRVVRDRDPELALTEESVKGDPYLQAVIRERNRWFFSLEVEKKQEKLFELEVLLKGLDRFFNLDNQPISDPEQVLSRDFANELRILRNAVFRVIILSRILLPDREARSLHFKNYVETRLASDFQRAQIIERTLSQRTPVESLYVLCHSFINFHELLNNLLKLQDQSYFIFHHLEQLISREIAANRFFNPFKAAGFAPHYDVIQSSRISRIVRTIPDPNAKRYISMSFLMLYKLLRYLSFIPSDSTDLDTLKNSLLIYALIRSEGLLIGGLFENELSRQISRAHGISRSTRDDLLKLLDPCAYQINSEIYKIFQLELKDAATQEDPNILRTGITRSRGLLTNMFQQIIVQLAQIFEPELEGKDLFRDYISRLEQSLKLRKDVWLFKRIIENLEAVIEECEPRAEHVPIIEAIKTLRNFIFYYQNISFQFVRSADRDDFDFFFQIVDGLPPSAAESPENFEPFKRELHSFKLFLETTLTNINNRSELRGLPFGTEEGERLLAQFLK
jgi:hypothetical protein